MWLTLPLLHTLAGIVLDGGGRIDERKRTLEIKSEDEYGRQTLE